jgi:hypothetical protein
MTDKEAKVNETLTQVGKYLEFYSFQANREALLDILNKFYDSAFKLGEDSGFNSAIESEPIKNESGT